jgi:hypothetical protein
VCGGHDTWKHGHYERRPWTLDGRQTVRMQRYLCRRCRRTFRPEVAQVERRRWYGRDVRRLAIDHWQHVGSSLRRTAELARSLVGRQERQRSWRPWDWEAAAAADGRGCCALSGSTVARWVDDAGRRAAATLRRQLRGVPQSGQVGADGLWVRLAGGTKAVVLLRVDRVTGVAYPPLVAPDEDEPAHWGRLVRRAAEAGLRPSRLRGLVSDGTRGLARFVEARLVWVHRLRARCVFHLWRNLARPLREALTTAAAGLTGAAATAVKRATRRELVALVRAVLDATDDAAAVAALRTLAAHRLGAGLARALRADLEQALAYRSTATAGLGRVGPEWYWRDFRLRRSRGRNHRSAARLERAALLWATYRTFEAAQARCERKRPYRRPGQRPLAAAGVPPGEVSYLDARAV